MLGKSLLMDLVPQKIGISIRICDCPLGATEKREEFARALMYFQKKLGLVFMVAYRMKEQKLLPAFVVYDESEYMLQSVWDDHE